MKKKYMLTPQQLHNHIQNVIRIYNDYRLDKKMQPNNTYRIYTAHCFYLYQMFPQSDGSTEIKMQAGKSFGKISNEDAVALVQTFYNQLDQVVNGQVVLTSDILNKDVYKSGASLIAGVNLVRLIVAVIAIVMALMALMHA